MLTKPSVLSNNMHLGTRYIVLHHSVCCTLCTTCSFLTHFINALLVYKTYIFQYEITGLFNIQIIHSIYLPSEALIFSQAEHVQSKRLLVDPKFS